MDRRPIQSPRLLAAITTMARGQDHARTNVPEIAADLVAKHGASAALAIVMIVKAQLSAREALRRQPAPCAARKPLAVAALPRDRGAGSDRGLA